MNVDSRCVVQLVDKPNEEINEYTPLIRSIKDLTKRDYNITFNHVYREANFTADFLANYALEFPLGLHLNFIVNDLYEVAHPVIYCFSSF